MAAVPKDWPQEAESEFERVKVLGRGAFGEVWLAKRRHPAAEASINDKDPSQEEYVAIKGVSIKNEQEAKTAAREIAILEEVNHPNIIQLLKGYEPASPNALGRYLAMSFVQGKEVGEILEERGALHLSLARLIARHLVSAVAYLHIRGVMHRDLKPDNIILSGFQDNLMWVDEETMREQVDSGKLNAILVDFGLARATREEDYADTAMKDVEKPVVKKVSFSSTSSGRGSSRRRSKLIDSVHASRRVFRTMSAVGSRHFVAPEIMSTIRRKSKASTSLCLTECVSSYALICDAYAVGATILEMMTGVPPGEDVESYVAENRVEIEGEPVIQSSKSFFSCCSSDAVVQEPKSAETTICLRYMQELPCTAHDLIKNMMQENADERLSVRDAQDHDFIGGYDSLPSGDYPTHTDDPMVFLKNEAAFV